MVDAGESEFDGVLTRWKLLILCSDESDKKGRNAEVRYTAGTYGIHLLYRKNSLGGPAVSCSQSKRPKCRKAILSGHSNS
jgi:hypothetical protein